LTGELGGSPNFKSPPRLGYCRGLKSVAKRYLRDSGSNAISMKQTMKVSIHFFGTQRTITKTDSIHMPITERTCVTDALEYVKERYPDLPLDKKMVLITVNQEMASLETLLRENDIVLFIPFIGGG